MATTDPLITAEYNPPERASLRGCVIWGLAALFYFYEFMLQASTSVMVPDLMRDFNVQGSELGHLSAFYFYTYALMQIPVGMLMDRYGPKRLLLFASLLCAVGCVFFANAAVLYQAEIGRGLMGLGGSFAVVGCMKIASLWFPTRRFALLAGLMVAIGMLGAASGQAPFALVIGSIGWRQTIIYGAVVGFVIAALIFAIVKDHPLHTARKASKVTGAHLEHIPMLLGVWRVMKQPQSWIASLFAALMFVPTTGFGELWGVPYIMTLLDDVSRPAAGTTLSLIFFGWAVGGPIFGWISDHFARRKLPMYVSAIGTLFLMYFVIFIDNPSLTKIGWLLFLLGAFSSGFVVAFSVIREINIPLLSGTAIGFINTLNTLGGAIAQPMIGKLLDQQWTGETVDGARVFSLEAYQNAFIFIPICLGIAIACLPFIKETYAKLLTSSAE